MKSRSKLLLIILVVLVVGGVGAFFLLQPAKVTSIEGAAKTVRVSRGDLSVSATVTGKLNQAGSLLSDRTRTSPQGR